MKQVLTKYTTLFVLLFLISTNANANNLDVMSEGDWISVQSKNFFLIGNASEKDIRKVATKLEQFRQTFRSLFPKEKFEQTIGTNVVVFKDFHSYKPFLPKRSDGRTDTEIAGYFQPGEDVNYITLAAQSGNLLVQDKEEDIYGTVFHEYVHFLLNTKFGRSEIPPWFNEGLAEYYQTFEIQDNQKVFLGKLQKNHLLLLQNVELIPLRQFFSIDNYSLHENGNHSRSIFYAQAWALIHYLKQTKQSDNMDNFLRAVMNDVNQEKAFRDAFGLDYAAMEKALKDYVKQKKFNITVATFQRKLLFDESMTVKKLSRADAFAYLGDLLYHTNRNDDAERYLKDALSMDSNQSLANASLGLVKMRQGKFDDAKKFLSKAIKSNQKNHFAHYSYAYVLSRESLDEFGRVTGYPKETVKIMRQSLLNAIELNPNFTESYSLLAFINLVNNEDLGESIKYLKKALSLQPGNQKYSLILAQIYLRQNKYDESEKLATKLAKTSIEAETRNTANEILTSIKEFRKHSADIEKYNLEKANKLKEFREKENVKKKSDLTAEEIEKIELENNLISLNRFLKKAKVGEKQVVGYTQRIQCLRGGIKYTIKTEKGMVYLRSRDFQGLDLFSLDENAKNALVGCNAKVRHLKTVYTYRPRRNSVLRTNGDIVRMTFVPKIFKLKTPEELANSKYIRIIDDKRQKQLMYESIKKNLPKLNEDEKRAVGVLEKIECFKDTMFFQMKINGQNMRLHTNSFKDVPFRVYSKEASLIRFGCGLKPPPLYAVITYTPVNVSVINSQGVLSSLDFVPKDFTLE